MFLIILALYKNIYKTLPFLLWNLSATLSAIMSLAGVTFVNESNYSSDVGAPASISPAQDSDICSLLLPREHPPIVEHVLFSIKFAINLFGLFSNFMVVYVYALKRDKHPSEHLICSLGFIDVFLSLMSLVFMSSVAVYKRQSDESEFFCRLVVCTLNASAFIFSTYSSGFLICVVTINRQVITYWFLKLLVSKGNRWCYVEAKAFP